MGKMKDINHLIEDKDYNGFKLATVEAKAIGNKEFSYRDKTYDLDRALAIIEVMENHLNNLKN
tara:strand:+ start:326 stop:514 length:189 start_codon:yes stop_codon:yes gene_type:complete